MAWKRIGTTWCRHFKDLTDTFSSKRTGFSGLYRYGKLAFTPFLALLRIDKTGTYSTSVSLNVGEDEQWHWVDAPFESFTPDGQKLPLGLTPGVRPMRVQIFAWDAAQNPDGYLHIDEVIVYSLSDPPKHNGVQFDSANRDVEVNNEEELIDDGGENVF